MNVRISPDKWFVLKGGYSILNNKIWNSPVIYKPPISLKSKVDLPRIGEEGVFYRIDDIDQSFVWSDNLNEFIRIAELIE